VSEEKLSTPSAQWRKNGESDPHGNHYDCERAKLSMGNLSDDEIANGAFMNYDAPLNIQGILAGKHNSPIAWMQAVKDRIRWLSRALFKSEQQRDSLIKFSQSIKDFAEKYPHDIGLYDHVKYELSVLDVEL